MAKRPVSAFGNRRPITEYARMAAAMGGHIRYKVDTQHVTRDTREISWAWFNSQIVEEKQKTN